MELSKRKWITSYIFFVKATKSRLCMLSSELSVNNKQEDKKGAVAGRRTLDDAKGAEGIHDHIVPRCCSVA